MATHHEGTGDGMAAPQAGEELDSFAYDGDSDYRGYMTDVSSTEDEAFIRNATISQDGTFTRAAQYRRLLSEMGQQINQESTPLSLLISGGIESTKAKDKNNSGSEASSAVSSPGLVPHIPAFKQHKPPGTTDGTGATKMPRRKITRNAAWRAQTPKRENKDKDIPESSATHLSPDEHKQQLNQASLAQSLARIGEQHLGFDTSDDAQGTSLYIGYLLDTIQMLQSEIHFARASYSSGSDSEREDHEEPKETGKTLAPSQTGKTLAPSQTSKPLTHRSQLLHRIICTYHQHGHHTNIYLDEPKARNKAYDQSLPALPGLVANKRVVDLNAYLTRHPDIAFVVFRHHRCGMADANSIPDGIQIVSEKLRRQLDLVAEYPYSQMVWGLHQIVAPYNFVFHHRKKLAERIEQDPELEPDVQPFLDWFSANFGEEFDEAESMLSRNVISARHIGRLFKPYEMAICKKAGIQEAFIVTNQIANPTSFDLDGWSWQYDGTQLTRRKWVVNLHDIPEGTEVAISSLTAYPVSFATQNDMDKIESRGRKFWDMKGQAYTMYNGWDKNRTYQYVGARFMVDVATYQLMHGTALVHQAFFGIVANKFDHEPRTIDREETLSSRNLMLLPSTIFGFSLLEKKWVHLNVEQFSPVDWNEQAFKRLVLDEKIKEMIQALVEVQKTAEKMDDIISGKGNGLIILLHGSPGTGKTLTAESVAEVAKKPLYRVTCGDIGTEAQQVEKYLKTVLHLGKIWDCVLLLDEADVFLEERTMADLERNSLVSVFLRVLEYYDGILILTSNRVGTFDEAFKSRIQVAIHYDNLTRKSRKAIWTNFLRMIEESPQEDANMAELERRLDELAAEEMNGRQIRNALLTARQLAKHRKERLDWHHLSQVIRTSAAFNKYLKNVKGHSDEQWARQEMIR